jgi:hypothetical protein
MSEDNRTYAEILGPAKVAELMRYAAAADEVVNVVIDYVMRSGKLPLEAFEDLIPMVRAALADHVPMATNLPC